MSIESGSTRNKAGDMRTETTWNWQCVIENTVLVCVVHWCKPSYVQLCPLYLKYIFFSLDVTHVIKFTRLYPQFSFGSKSLHTWGRAWREVTISVYISVESN